MARRYNSTAYIAATETRENGLSISSFLAVLILILTIPTLAGTFGGAAVGAVFTRSLSPDWIWNGVALGLLVSSILIGIPLATLYNEWHHRLACSIYPPEQPEPSPPAETTMLDAPRTERGAYVIPVRSSASPAPSDWLISQWNIDRRDLSQFITDSLSNGAWTQYAWCTKPEVPIIMPSGTAIDPKHWTRLVSPLRQAGILSQPGNQGDKTELICQPHEINPRLAQIGILL